MTDQLHLLRPYVGWRCGQVENAQAYIERLAADHESCPGSTGRFGTWTTRVPRRHKDLPGGSVYFVVNGKTHFRMPFAGIQFTAADVRARRTAAARVGCWLLMRLEYIPVEPLHVKFLRGWRYLEGVDAPQDLVLPGDVPDDVEFQLRQVGVL